MLRQKTTHVDDPSDVGERLRSARRAARLTLRDLSFPGCSAGYLSHIEHGERTPSLQVLVELGRRLGVSAEYLAWGHNGHEPHGAAGLPSGFALDAYREALGRAETKEERVWLLAGMAQFAIGRGDRTTAARAFRRALEALD